MNAAMDAIADRLYTPLILVRLGASATDLGTEVPWIPTEDDLADFEEALDGALAADFRVLIHHFGVQMEPVFGRENMPNLNEDFDRLEGRILQTFGLSQTMLSGADAGETYAADAMNRDLISQLLTTYQNLVASHYRQRALVVAEAQEHYDFEVRNGKRYVVMEEILEVDEETGEERIVEQPKLLIPDIKFKSMNVQNEEVERQFLEALRAGGVPISIKTRIANSDIDFDDEVERSQDEQVQLAVAEQETRKRIYMELKQKGLPIPQDLRADFDPKAAQAQDTESQGERIPMFGTDQIAATPNLAPTMQDIVGQPADNGGAVPGQASGGTDPGGGMATVIPLPGAGAPPDVPPESNEMRGTMPKAGALYRRASRMREVVADHYNPPPEPEYDDEGQPKVPLRDLPPRGKFGDPKHIGMRRWANVRPQQPMEDWYYVKSDEESA